MIYSKILNRLFAPSNNRLKLTDPLKLDLHNITLAVHDWGGPVGLGFAIRHPAKIPTLIVWGMLDPVLPDSVLRWWKDVFPQATIHEIEDASHFLQEDAPQRIGGYISEFMAAYQ